MCILYGICAMLFYCARYYLSYFQNACAHLNYPSLDSHALTLSRYLRNPQEATIEKQPLLIESHRRITKVMCVWSSYFMHHSCILDTLLVVLCPAAAANKPSLRIPAYGQLNRMGSGQC